MTEPALPARVELIPIDQIAIVNPRVRNKQSFREIVDNVAKVGLKKPITVARRNMHSDIRYDLVCGQGRLEAYLELGQKLIPAFVTNVDVESGMVMSLVENLARRHHSAMDLLHDIEGMKSRGYDQSEIARKTGLSLEYVRGVANLIEKGEGRLLRAVEAGHVPVTTAVRIAESDDSELQAVLQQAYESNALRGRKLLLVKRLIEQRHRSGKDLDSRPKRTRPLSVDVLLRTYTQEADKKRSLVRKAETTRGRLVFATEAMRTLLLDGNFVNLLREEGLDSMPKNLCVRLDLGART
jgi:ParB family chromosome partitioning protein